MKKVKQVYNYLFYKFYKMSEGAPSKWMSEWKASLVVDILIFFFIYSILIYYSIFINIHINIGKTNVIVLLGIIILTLNYFTFHHKDQWKDIVNSFDKLPKRKNIIGSWAVFGLVFLVIANLVFSFYCLDRQARKDQVGPYAPEIVAKKRKEDSLQKAQQIENLKKIYGEDKK